MTDRAKYPHCNTQVLHAPGRCAYCDEYSDRQQERIAGGTPFTPDEANGWSGNVAAPAGSVHHHMGASWVVPGQPQQERDNPFFADHSRIARGWYCKLPDGHEGACPAWPTRLTRIIYTLKGRRIG